MNKDFKQALEYLNNRIYHLQTSWIGNNDMSLEKEATNTIKQYISRLEKHKNDLGDLLAKREEQLDR